MAASPEVVKFTALKIVDLLVPSDQLPSEHPKFKRVVELIEKLLVLERFNFVTALASFEPYFDALREDGYNRPVTLATEALAEARAKREGV